MDSAPCHDDATLLRLPRRALLVSGSTARAAMFATAFDDVRISTPDALDAALAECSEIDCVGISAVGIDDGSLAEVVEAVRRAGTGDLSVFVDVSDPVGLQLLHVDASALAGLAVIGPKSVAGVASLVLKRGVDGAVPDLSPYRDGPAEMWRGRQHSFGEADRLAADLKERASQRRITDLEAALQTAAQGLAVTRAALATATAKPKPAASPPMRLSGRSAKLQVTAVGGVVIVAVAVFLALATSTGYTGGLLSAACLLGAVVALYVIRAHRRLARAVTNTQTELRRAFAAVEARDADLAKQIAEVNEALRVGSPTAAAIERRVELVGASAVDIARTLGYLVNGLQLPEGNSQQAKG
ncbi:MAG: hypothetical protein ACRDWT_18620 [Jatrophihabitantaceae bacterium]